MTCREFADFMSDYLSGELSAESWSQFEQHLSVCPNCVSYLAFYSKTVKMGKRAFEDDEEALPTDMPEALVKAIMEARRRH